MCPQIQALFRVLAQFVVEQLLQVIEPYNVMTAKNGATLDQNVKCICKDLQRVNK